VIAKYCKELRWRHSLCMLRFRSAKTSFEVASSMARKCHGRNECATGRREMRAKKTQRKTRRKKDGKAVGRRRTAHYCRRLRMSSTQLDGAGWDDRRTAARASSRRRLLRVATDGGKHKSLRDCAVAGRLPPQPSSSQLFHPKLRRWRRRRRTPTDISGIFPGRPR